MNRSKTLIKILLCVVMLSLVATVGMAAEQLVVKGTVDQTEAGVVIKADDADYIVAGQDLSKMVGKKVMVSGTVSESEAGKTIHVMEFQEINE